MYTPLNYCKMMNLSDMKQNSEVRYIFERCYQEFDDCIRFIQCDQEFMSSEYQGKFKTVNDWLIKNHEKMFKFMYMDELEGQKEKRMLDAAKDILLPYLIVNKWSENKQVYQFDAELELALCDVEEVRLPVRILDRLPYQTLYVDFAEDGIFKSNFHGAFVNFVKHHQGYIMSMMRVTEDGRSMTGSCELFAEDGHDHPVFVVNSASDILTDEEGSHVDWKLFGMFILNAMLYLCTENGEIRENETTKKTYKPGKTIKNKFSEIRKYECGYVYGATIRLEKKRQEKHSEREEDCLKADKERMKRNAVRPHTRKAHWHHYWVGKGRQELILKWIPPTSVGYGEKIATIHPCKR